MAFGSTFDEQFERALSSKLANQDQETALGRAQEGNELLEFANDTAATSTFSGRGAAQQAFAPLQAQGFTPSFAQPIAQQRGAITPSSFGNPLTSPIGELAGDDRFARGYANGGVVRGYAMGGPVSASPGDMKMHPLYQQYVKAMKNAGMGKSVEPPESVIPRLAQQQAKAAQQQRQGFADGGEVDVGGKLVTGPGTGKSDSIPANIDGEQPAALSNGEFIMPKKVVDYFGTKFFDSLVEKARMAMKKQSVT